MDNIFVSAITDAMSFQSNALHIKLSDCTICDITVLLPHGILYCDIITFVFIVYFDSWSMECNIVIIILSCILMTMFLLKQKQRLKKMLLMKMVSSCIY